MKISVIPVHDEMHGQPFTYFEVSSDTSDEVIIVNTKEAVQTAIQELYEAEEREYENNNSR